MRFLKQFGIILLISFIGELCNHFIPLPIPASIYGLVLLFIGLCTHIIPVTSVKEVSTFLLETMPVMFVPVAVGLMDSWDFIARDLVAYFVVMAATTFIVMAVSGLTTQAVIRWKKKKEGEIDE